MPTYTISENNGSVLRGMTAEQVMEHILSADGYRWAIRPVQGCYRIFRSTHSANSPMGAREMTAHGKPVVANTENEARAELAAWIVTDFTGWKGFHGDVMTDAEYDRLATEAE